MGEKKFLTEVHYTCVFLLFYKVNTNFDLDKQFSLYNFDILVCNEAHWRYHGLRLPINSKKDLYRDTDGKK